MRNSPAAPAPSQSKAPAAKILSPRRKPTEAHDVATLAREQLAHFHLDPQSPVGAPLLRLTEKLYAAHGDLDELWKVTTRELATLPRGDRLALFNAKKF